MSASGDSRNTATGALSSPTACTISSARICMSGVTAASPAPAVTAESLIVLLLSPLRRRFVPRARNADGRTVLGADVAVEDVLAAARALGLVERALHRRIHVAWHVLDLEDRLVGQAGDPLDEVVGDLEGDLGGLDAALAVAEELVLAHLVHEVGVERIAHGALLRMGEHGRQLAPEGAREQELAVGGASGGLDAVHHAGLRVALAELGDDVEAVILLALDAQALHGELAHAVADGHERAAMAMELEGPLWRCVRGGHDTPPKGKARFTSSRTAFAATRTRSSACRCSKAIVATSGVRCFPSALGWGS